MSKKKKDVHFEGVLRRDDAVRMLEGLVESLRQGRMSVTAGQRATIFHPGQVVDLKVEGSSEGEREKVSIRLNWAPEGHGALQIHGANGNGRHGRNGDRDGQSGSRPATAARGSQQQQESAAPSGNRRRRNGQAKDDRATRARARQQEEQEEGPIDLNEANADDLASVPGIGLATAKRIIANRKKKGPFESVDDLTRVPGIGQRMVESWSEYLTA